MKQNRSIFLEMLLAGAAICLLLGLTLPVVRLSWLYFFTSKHSILSVIKVLIGSGEWFLGIVLAVFSVLFPLLKLSFLLMLYWRSLDGNLPEPGILGVLSWLGRWSMLDVLILALVVFYVKQQGMADAMALPGIYFFAISVLLTMWASELAEQIFASWRRQMEKNSEGPRPLLEDKRPQS